MSPTSRAASRTCRSRCSSAARRSAPIPGGPDEALGPGGEGAQHQGRYLTHRPAHLHASAGAMSRCAPRGRRILFRAARSRTRQVHSIASSARPSSDIETVRPSALAEDGACCWFTAYFLGLTMLHVRVRKAHSPKLCSGPAPQSACPTMSSGPSCSRPSAVAGARACGS